MNVNMNPKNMVRCSQCHQLKPVTDFSRHWRSASGHLPICKTCQGKRIAAGRKVPVVNPHSPWKAYNPKFEGQVPRQLIAQLRELVAELRNRGFYYKGILRYVKETEL